MEFDPVYVEYAPVPSLAHLVDCYWSSVSAWCGVQRRHTVLPDGCIDFLFDLSAGNAAHMSLVGAMTRPLHFARTGKTHVLAVRFRPGGAFAFLRRPVDEFNDQRIDLGDLWPTEGVFEEDLCRAPSALLGVRRIEQELLGKIQARAHRAGPFGPSPARSRMTPSNFRVSAVCAQLGVSRQHLARSFRREVGLGPKALSRIVRARGVLDRIQASASEGPDAAQLALRSGYCDQSHMIAEFRSLTGSTPARYLSKTRFD